jgi:prolyl 4-hydroxylase
LRISFHSINQTHTYFTHDRTHCFDYTLSYFEFMVAVKSSSCGCWRIIYLTAAYCLWIPTSEAALAASGGGGGGRGFGSSRSSSPSRINNKKTTTIDSGTPTTEKQSKKNKRNRVLADLLMDPADTQQQAGNSADPKKEQQIPLAAPQQQLDKWGLPPPTLDDIFPPPSADTKIVAATRDKYYDLADIQAALKGYIALDLSRAWETCTKITLVHESPPVLVLDDFLTADECREIQQVAGLIPTPPLGGGAAEEESSISDDGKDLRRRSRSPPPSPVQIPSATMSTTLAQSVRTSTSWFCHYASVSTLLVKMEHLLGIDLTGVEEPQIVRYRPRQQFTWHYDHLPTTQLLANGGQRLATVLVYLNDCPDAPTVFRDLHGTPTTTTSQQQEEGEPPPPPPLAVAPVTGRALLFFPAWADGEPDERTLHCGMPAVVAEKHMIQCWVHQSAYTAALPPDNRQTDVDRVGTRRRLGYENES